MYEYIAGFTLLSHFFRRWIKVVEWIIRCVLLIVLMNSELSNRIAKLSQSSFGDEWSQVLLDKRKRWLPISIHEGQIKERVISSFVNWVRLFTHNLMIYTKYWNTKWTRNGEKWVKQSEIRYKAIHFLFIVFSFCFSYFKYILGIINFVSYSILF